MVEDVTVSDAEIVRYQCGGAVGGGDGRIARDRGRCSPARDATATHQPAHLDNTGCVRAGFGCSRALRGGAARRFVARRGRRRVGAARPTTWHAHNHITVVDHINVFDDVDNLLHDDIDDDLNHGRPDHDINNVGRVGVMHDGARRLHTM